MSFILAKQRDIDPNAAWKAYQRYIEQNRQLFPDGALELVTSDWYFDSQDHRCPHDSWLEWCRLGETATGARKEVRRSSFAVRLMGAYHDGYIELHYPVVYSLSLSSARLERGHGDWRYDEFRISDSGKLVHEIEWRSSDGDSRWLIEASDVEFHWIPEARTKNA